MLVHGLASGEHMLMQRAAESRSLEPSSQRFGDSLLVMFRTSKRDYRSEWYHLLSASPAPVA